MSMFNSASPFADLLGMQEAAQRQDLMGPLPTHWGFNTGGGRGPWPLSPPMGVPTTQDEMGRTWMSPGNQNSNLMGGGVLQDALGRDVQAFEQAAGRQFDRNQQQIDALSQFLQAGPGALLGVAGQTSGELSGLAGQAFGLGEQQLMDAQGFGDALMGSVNQGVDGALEQARGDVTGQVDLADQLIQDAIAGFKQTISQFEDRTAQDAASIASGIRRNAQSQMQMARAGINPDGTPMTMAQQSQLITQIQGRVGEQVNDALVPLFTSHNNTMAQLGAQLAQLQQGGAQVALQGGQLLADQGQRELAGEQLKGQVGLQVGEQLLRAQQGQRQMFQVGATLSDMSTQIRNAATLSAVNLELQGRELLAGLVASNPESVVSWFQGLLALYATQSAATGRTA